MNTNKRNKLSYGPVVFALLFFISLPAWALPPQEHKKIVEEVYVENIEVPVRVFAGKQPVKGLKKEDFQLFLEGKRTAINAFYEVSQQLQENLKLARDTSLESQAEFQPRLFVLIFNISDYHLDFTSHLDLLFDRIIRAGDSIIVITNRYFIPEWEVDIPSKAKERISEILVKELKKVKFEVIGFESELKANSSMLKSRLSDPKEREEDASRIFKDFFLTYQFILEDMKKLYLSIPVDQYIKIAGYLRGQRVDKWVLNFYQLGRVPMLDQFGEIHRQIASYMDDSVSALRTGSQGPTGERDIKATKQMIKRLYFDFLEDLQKLDDWLVNDISKAFLNSGATFHTLLMKPVNPGFSTEFKYETVGTESENVLKKLAHLTGGSVTTSNQIKDFIREITVKEDIIYMLTYAPGKKKTEKLTIKIKDKNYRVVYDDQERVKYFEDMMKQLTRGLKNIEIRDIIFNQDLLTVKLDNIQLVEYEGDNFGAVQARIKILTKDKKLISDIEKTYKGIKEEGIFQAKLPPLAKGSYTIVLEVKDLFSLKNVYAGDGISITMR